MNWQCFFRQFSYFTYYQRYIFDILSIQKENHKIKTNTYSNALKVEDETKADIG